MKKFTMNGTSKRNSSCSSSSPLVILVFVIVSCTLAYYHLLNGANDEKSNPTRSTGTSATSRIILSTSSYHDHQHHHSHSPATTLINKSDDEVRSHQQHTTINDSSSFPSSSSFVVAEPHDDDDDNGVYIPSQFELSLFPNLVDPIRKASQSVFSTAYDVDNNKNKNNNKLSSSASLLFETSYQKITCGALMSNFCVWKGQPRYFRKGLKFFSSTGAIRCCNEAETKFRFHSVMLEPFDPQQQQQKGFPAPFFPKTILVAPMCWDQYGYHLFICLLNTWSVMSQLKFASSSSSSKKIKVKIALLKSWSGNRLGSSSDFWNPYSRGQDQQQQDVQESLKTKSSSSSSSPFWAWWKSLVDHPSHVIDLASQPPICVPYGLVAGKLEIITPRMQQSFRLHMIRKLGLLRRNEKRQKSDAPVLKITVIDREKTFKLLNSQEIANQFEKVANKDERIAKSLSSSSSGYKVESKVVIFEKLSLKEQMQTAIDTDIMVGMHGNGLTWSAFMEQKSALVELWPSFPYNSNYAHFAGRANIKRWNVVGNTPGCPKRCNAAIQISDDVVREVIQFVVDAKIAKTIEYRGDEEYLRGQAAYSIEKKNKGSKRKGGV